MIVKERLAQVMRDQGVTQGQLARAIGVSPPAIQQILNGKTQTTRHLDAIAAFLTVSRKWLAGQTDDPNDELVKLIDSVAQLPLLNIGELRGENLEFSRWINIDRSLIKFDIDAPEAVFIAVQLQDDAMAPSLRQDAIIIITYPTGPESIDRQDAVWLVEHHGIPLVRRVRIIGKDRVRLSADNPNRAPIEAGLDEIVVAGRLLWVAQSSD